jgi:hypothetical protein
MQFVRKLLLILLVPIFTLLLYATAVDVGFVRVAGSPSEIKKILNDSGIYSSVVPGLLDQSKQVSGGGGDVSLTNPTVKAAAVDTFTPQFVQKNTETVIDSVYRWLDGSTFEPDFSIDLTPIKASFAANAAKEVQTKLATLPACATAVAPQDFDAINATCLPKGVDPATAAAKIQNNLSSGKGFLDHPIISASSIKNGDSGQSVFTSKNVKNVPKAYQAAKSTPAILGLLTLLLALAVVFLSPNLVKGLRRAGIILVGVGIFMLIFASGVTYGVNNQALPKLHLNNLVLEAKVRILLKDAVGQIETNYWEFGGAYLVLGALAIGASIYMNEHGAKEKDDLEGEGKTKEDRIDLKEPDKAISLPEEKSSSAPKPAAKKPTSRSRPGPKKIIIQ